MGAQGYKSIMLVEDGTSSGVGEQAFDSSSEFYPYDSETMAKTTSIIDSHGLRGSRARHWQRVTDGTYSIGGTVTMRPGRDAIDAWLPRILGGTEATDVFPLADALPPFAMLFDKGYGLAGSAAFGHQYYDCKVGKATFTASVGQTLTLAMDMVGREENATDAWPTPPAQWYSPTLASRPMELTEAVLTLAGSGVAFESVEVVIDNFVQAKYFNAQAATYVDPTDRLVTLKATIDHTTANQTLLYGLGKDGIAGTLVFGTTDNMTTTFTFTKLVPIDTTPTVGGKSAVTRTVTFQAFATGDTADATEKEIAITNDMTFAS